MSNEQGKPASTGGFLLDPHAVMRRLSSTSMKAAPPLEADAQAFDVPVSVAPPPPDESSSG
jgi:hypothetical protein